MTLCDSYGRWKGRDTTTGDAMTSSMDLEMQYLDMMSAYSAATSEVANA